MKIQDFLDFAKRENLQLVPSCFSTYKLKSKSELFVGVRLSGIETASGRTIFSYQYSKDRVTLFIL